VIASRDPPGQGPGTPAAPCPGDPIDRRTLLGSLLRGAAATSLALGVPPGLAACSTYIRPAPRTRGFAIDVAPLPPGVSGLIAARAASVGITPPTNVGTSTVSQRGAAFGGLTERQPGGNFDPVYDRSPRTADLVVVQADASLDPVARTVIGQGVQVVTYLAPLRHQTAQIAVAPGSLAALLASDALAWARTMPRADVTALFVTGIAPYGSVQWISEHGPPPPGPPPPVVASADEQAIRAAFGGAVPRVAVSALPSLYDPIGALKADPGVRFILCGNDSVALQVAQALRQHLSPDRRDRLYVGGLGTPSIGQAGTLEGQGSGVEPWVRELRRDGILRALATVPLRDLADAIIDLPAALMRGKPAYDVSLSPVLLKPRSPALAEYALDSAR
jgi:hypothetical protein